MRDFRLGILDIALVVISALGIFVFSFLLINESLLRDSFMSNSQSGEPIGYVFSAKNDVRRRPGRSLLWFQVERDERIFERDSIFTGENSETELLLNDGVNLKIWPNSLVVLVRQDDRLFLDLQVGGVVANLEQGGSVNVLQQGQVAEIEGQSKGGQLTLTRDFSQHLNVQSSGSNVRVRVNEVVEEIQGNDSIKIDTKLNVKKEVYTVELTHPIKEANVWLNPGEPISFKWEGQNPSDFYKIQISSDSDFERILINEVADTSYSTDRLTREQIYYWRIVTEDEQPVDLNNPQLGSDIETVPKSRTASFHLVLKKPPRLTYPLANSNLRSIQNIRRGEKVPVRFKWQSKSGIEKYELQVAEDERFENIVHKSVVRGNEKSGLEFEKGIYHWRVRPLGGSPIAGESSQIYSFGIGRDPLEPGVVQDKQLVMPEPAYDSVEQEGQAPTELSTVTRFRGPVGGRTLGPTFGPQPGDPRNMNQELMRIDYGDLYVLSAPRLSPPHIKLTLEFPPEVPLSRGLAAVRDVVKNPPVLAWEGIRGAEFYRVEIAKDAAFQQVVSDVVTEKKDHIWSQVDPGRFYWRVQALRRGRPFSRVSQLGKLWVQVPQPQLPSEIRKLITVDSPDKVDKPGPPIQLNWPQVPLASGYEVLLSKDGQRINEFEVVRPELKALLPETGVYEVKLAALGQNREIISEFTDAIPLTFQKKFELLSPELLLPRNGTTVLSIGIAKDPILFNWSGVKFAERYKVQFSTDPAFSNILAEHETSNTNYIPPFGFPIGTVYWRIRAKHRKYQSEWSEVSAFNIGNMEK